MSRLIMARQAISKYSLQGTAAAPVFGTATTPATACGMVGWNLRKDAKPTRFRAPGTPNLIVSKGGMASIPFEFDFLGIQAADFFQTAIRTNGVLPYYTLGLGWLPDGAAPTPVVTNIRDCKTHSIEFRVQAGESASPITGRLSGVGGVPTANTTVTKGQLSPAPFMYHEMIGKIATVGTKMLELSARVEHSVKVGAFLADAAKTVGEERFFDYQDEGDEVITGEIVVPALLSYALQTGGALVEQDLDVTFTNLDDNTKIFHATFLGCTFGDVAYGPRDSNGEVTFRYPFEAKTWTLTNS